MLRKRSRGINSKPGVMADHGLLSSSSSSSTDIHNSPNSSFFNSSRHFTGFSTKIFSETEAVMSPTSILDSKPFSGIGNPFWHDKSTKSPDSQTDGKNPVNRIESRGVGLGIIEALDETPDMKFSKSDSRRVLFGSQLKIQIPEIQTGSLQSPREFGIKTRNSQMDCFSPSRSPFSGQKTPLGSTNFCQETPNSPSIITGSLSVSEMELSEDYTCVISHGPNPRTTHIFDNCIVESCVGFTNSKNEISFYGQYAYPSNSFLSFCYACKKNLEQGKDIYMYRGEKAFCSLECRHQEMLFDDDMEKPPFPDQLDELLDVADTRS